MCIILVPNREKLEEPNILSVLVKKTEEKITGNGKDRCPSLHRGPPSICPEIYCDPNPTQVR